MLLAGGRYADIAITLADCGLPNSKLLDPKKKTIQYGIQIFKHFPNERTLISNLPNSWLLGLDSARHDWGCEIGQKILVHYN